MKITKTENHLIRIALLAFGLGLAGCNDSQDTQSTQDTQNPSSSLQVAPSLGFVRQADVRVLDLAGRELASGSMDDSGTLTFPTDVKGGFIVEVHGNDDATYYDEGVRAWRALPADTILHAASANGRGAIAVTALTEIAYQRARQLAGAGALTAAHINQANAELAVWLANVPERIEADGTQVMSGDTPDILAPAQQVDGGERLRSDTPEGRHAILLASLAQQAYAGAVQNDDVCVEDARCSPLLPLIAYIATDFADGVLDNKNPHGTSMGLPFIDPAVHPGDIFPEVPGDDLTPQQEVGREFPGSYTLTCSGDSQPTTMVIADNGAMTLSGPHGDFDLPFDDLARSSPLVEHAYRLTPTGKAFTARLVHIEPGTVREVYCMQYQDYETVVDLEINAHVDGSVQIRKGDAATDCHTTFAHGVVQPPIPYFTDILYSPDFICTHTGGGPLTLGTLSFGPTSFFKDGVLQPVRHGDIRQYKHVVYKWRPTDVVSITNRPVTNNESYEWGTHTSLLDKYLALNRAALRWQGVPHMDTFDMQSTNNWQGMTNCSPDGPQIDLALYQGDGIVMDFGGTQLAL